MFYIITGILGIVVGALASYFIIVKKLYPQFVLERNRKEILEIQKQKILLLTKDCENQEQYKEMLESQCKTLSEQITSLTNNISQIKAQSQDIFKDQVEMSRKAAAAAIEEITCSIEQAKENYNQEYLTLLQDSAEIYQQKTEELNVLNEVLKTLQKKVDVATQEAKRREEEKNQKDFYRITLSNEDIQEIKHLRSIESFLRNSDALNKVIYKVYYERPATTMIGRVLGERTITGIYKITNIDNEMCYIGQSLDVAARWKQHIKRGVGAEAPTRNKLYPVMHDIGVEHFKFELLEECPPAELDEKEKYWQTFYHAQTYGYSMR